ncbi:MAG: iron ABC transporter permease [Planctomycetaceae bacterium]|nr:iron ABC transporter permease [Planctomycetaceae bacterium]
MANDRTKERGMMPNWAVGAVFVLAVLVVLAAPFWGMASIPLRALSGDVRTDSEAFILWEMRIPRVLMAFLAGVGLSVSGMVFQAMFRNPLATPFTLGVSSGASLGAAIAIQCGWTVTILHGVSTVSLSAFLGAVVSILLVYILTARSGQGVSPSTMLLAGVAVSYFFASLILFVQYTTDPSSSFRILRWAMGGLEHVVSFREVLGVMPFVVSGCLIVWYLTFDLNLLTTGEDFAFSRGVDVAWTKFLLFLGVSLMVGAVVAVCGPIGFVGLVAPHICRLLVGADHRRLFPMSLCFGGTFLVVCDTAARMIMPPAELPVGILTALLGGPFFLWLLLARKHDLESL